MSLPIVINSYTSTTNRGTAYYDRAAKDVSQTDSENTPYTPHALFTFWTYTVPSNRYAFMETLSARCIRASVAGTAGRAIADIEISGTDNQSHIDAMCLGNNIGDGERVALSNVGYLRTGATITAQTSDNSTGGTVEINWDALITEFDA